MRNSKVMLHTPIQGNPNLGEQKGTHIVESGRLTGKDGRYQEASRATQWNESRDVTCWSCKGKGHIVRNCPLWDQWRENQEKRGSPLDQRQYRQREREREVEKPSQLNLVRGPCGTFVAPNFKGKNIDV